MSHSNNIQRTLEAMFKKKTPSSGILKLSQGMQFDRPGAKFVWLLMMFVLIGAIMSFINGLWVVGLVLLPLIIPIAAYTIDVQGVEIDFKNDKIRHYRWFLGLHFGDWLPLNAFDSVRVYQHQLKTRRGLMGRATGKKYDLDAYYYVRLVSPGLNKSISLLELEDYNRAKYHAEKVARHARLIFIEKPARLKMVVIGKGGFQRDNA